MWHLNSNKDTSAPVGSSYMNFGKTHLNVFKKYSQQEQRMKVFGRQLRNFTSAIFAFFYASINALLYSFCKANRQYRCHPAGQKPIYFF
jgi:hypothetical protein